MATKIISKRCYQCKQIKPLLEFHKNCNRKDGHQGYCKICNAEHTRKWRQTKKGKKSQKRYSRSQKRRICNKHYKQSEKGKATEKRYEQSEKGKIVVRKKIKRFHIRHPEESKARDAVKKAIRNGQLPPPDSLQCPCGKPAKQYHHHKGYAPEHWLDVVPVCTKCHGHLRTFQNPTSIRPST